MATSQRRTIGVTALVIAVTAAAALSEPPDWLETAIWWVIAGAVLVAVLTLIPVTANHLPRIYLPKRWRYFKELESVADAVLKNINNALRAYEATVQSSDIYGVNPYIQFNVNLYNGTFWDFEVTWTVTGGATITKGAYVVPAQYAGGSNTIPRHSTANIQIKQPLQADMAKHIAEQGQVKMQLGTIYIDVVRSDTGDSYSIGLPVAVTYQADPL